LTGSSSAKRYDTVIDVEAETSHTRVLRLVGSDKRVLDLGCAYGGLAAELVVRGCEVVGVERDPEAAEAARAHCSVVLVCDLDSGELEVLTGLGKFDVILAADVLEHLSDPSKLLEKAQTLLTPGGYLVTSIPNVAHGSVRLALLAGRFPYAELGLLDATHLRFYTRESMCDLLEDAGFAVAYVEDQLLDAELGEVLRDIDVMNLPTDARELVRADPDSSVYQFIAVSTPHASGEGLLGALKRSSTHANSLRNQLGRGGDSTVRADLLEAQQETLAARRAVAYLNVQEEHSATRISYLEGHVERLTLREDDLNAVEAQLRRQQQVLAEIYGSRLWRVGTTYRRFLGRRSGR
jgi:SAM-dependent methyltransferase